MANIVWPNTNELEKQVHEQISVTPQMVVIAKALIIESAPHKGAVQSAGLIDTVLSKNNAQHSGQVVFEPSEDHTPKIKSLAEAVSWKLAAIEAILSLVHSGLLLSMSDTENSTFGVQFGVGTPEQITEQSGWKLIDPPIPIPARVLRAPSFGEAKGEFLSEPDLYLSTLGTPNMDPDVAEAFREAVKCFRHGLFTAAVAMLGKASEGAWLELGASLISAVPSGQQSAFDKQRNNLENSSLGPMKKVDSVLTIYSRQDIFAPVASASGVNIQELRSAQVWSDAIRDSRNTIHFRVSPKTPNTYEKVAALLIGAVPYMKSLYAVKSAADASSPTSAAS